MVDIDAAKPLGHWVVGTITLHFSEGAVVERRLHLDEARRIEAMLSDGRESDALDWDALAWYQFDKSKVVFSSFKVAEDGGWGMDPDEREAVRKAGHPHGVLRSLVDYWTGKDVPEPEYSLFALYALHRAAVDGMKRGPWDALARIASGADGARRLASALERAVPAEQAEPSAERPTADDLDVDDSVEPDVVSSDHEVPTSAGGGSPNEVADDGGADEGAGE